MLSNTSFGTNVLTNNFDRAILDGWGVRPSDWNLGVSIEHQILPRASVNVAYRRRWFHGFFVVDNLSLQPSDLTPFSIVAPVDARLPGGGGYVISGLYDVVPEKAGQVDNLVTDSNRYGTWSQYFNGVDVTVNVRTRGGLTIHRRHEHRPDRRGQLRCPRASAGARDRQNGDERVRCRSDRLRGHAGEPVLPCRVTASSRSCAVSRRTSVPKADVQLAATFQSKPGALLAANYAGAERGGGADARQESLGERAQRHGEPAAPGTMSGDRINELDIRVAKILKFGGSRSMLALDLYNALNSSAVLTYNTAFVPGGTWLQPLTILTPRFFRITAEVDF